MTHTKDASGTLSAHAELAGEKINLVIPKLYIEFCGGDINAGIVMREIVGLYAWSLTQEKIDWRQPDGFYRDDKDWKKAVYQSRRQVNRGIHVIEAKVKDLLGDDYEPLIAKKIAKPIVGKEGDELIYASSVATFYTVNSRIYDKVIQLFRKSHVGAVLPDVSERYDQNGTTGATEKVVPSITTQLTVTTDDHNDSSGDEEKAPTVDEMFETFWNAYGKKVNRPLSERSFAKAIKKTSIQTMLAAIETQKKSKKWVDGYRPNPSTWLNGEGWNDELELVDAPRQKKIVPPELLADMDTPTDNHESARERMIREAKEREQNGY